MQAFMRRKLTAFAEALVDQEKARIIVPAKRQEPGFWFGGGKTVSDGRGNLYLSGRYRNSGDSRTGLGLGERGAELAVFKSGDGGTTFAKIKSFSKADLSVGDWEVVSIEGSALRLGSGGETELFVSTEKKNRPFPEGLENYHKPGTGSWTIERMTGRGIEALDPGTLATVIKSDDPRWFNCKDPFLFDAKGGALGLGFCTHPFNWSSSNSAYAVMSPGHDSAAEVNFEFFPRGFCWDVGITRATCFLRVPKIGRFKDEDVTLVFYDGGEAMREYSQHEQAVKRPRGHSCEELGGAAFFSGGVPRNLERLSISGPLFVSPYGTGCSRYVDVLETEEGYYVTWQQSRKDFSQALVMSFLPREEAEKLLAG